MNEGFVYLDTVLPGVLWDAKYATNDNFTGTVVDGYHVNRVVGTCEMAAALLNVQSVASMWGYTLLLWDSYRPQRAVDHFLRWAIAPEDGKTKARYYPNITKLDIVPLGYVAKKSAHTRGSAIDLTLCGRDSGKPLDMGGGFDLLDEQSHHGADNVPQEAAKNRLILRDIMEQCGFNAYRKEWWHYTLKNDPYPDQYFDFPIE